MDVSVHMLSPAWFPELCLGQGPRPEGYNLDALKDLVALADAKGVTVVPKMEVPGHGGQ